jgi:predicted nucleic acid-binding protein
MGATIVAFVVDNSVVIGWLVPAQATAYTRRILERVRREQVVVPSLWPVELANVMIVRRRRAAMTPAQIHSALQRIQRLRIAVDGAAVSPESLFSIGERHGLSAYDAAYLELAQRRGIPLATGDDRLKLAARAAGVSLA